MLTRVWQSVPDLGGATPAGMRSARIQLTASTTPDTGPVVVTFTVFPAPKAVQNMVLK
jgi:hypothetical protein